MTMIAEDLSVAPDLRPHLGLLIGGSTAIAAISLFTLPWPFALASTLLGLFMIAGADVDARTFLLPDAVTYGALACGLLAAFFLEPMDPFSDVVPPWQRLGFAVLRAGGTALLLALLRMIYGWRSTRIETSLWCLFLSCALACLLCRFRNWLIKSMSRKNVFGFSIRTCSNVLNLDCVHTLLAHIAEMNVPYKVLSILLAGVLCNAADGRAATVTALLTERGALIDLKGDIVRDDANTVETLIRAAQANHRVVQGLRLDSPGGNLIGGIRLARLIRGHGDLSTIVFYGATCASACFLVFAAGREKFVGLHSFVGVHGAADKTGNVTEESEAATRAMARFCRELGVPSSITEKLLATPPNDIVWLSQKDLQSMGATLLTGRPRIPQAGR
jgi:hypothetical protein